jgi:hypothetical protein
MTQKKNSNPADELQTTVFICGIAFQNLRHLR